MKIRAYLIEDNPVIRENLLATLSELADIDAIGCGETEAEAAGWLRAHNGHWDLAIVDLFLRKGNGLNVLSALSQRQAHQKMVVFSNHATQEVRRRCQQLGADAVFDKSTEIDALLDYCQQHRIQVESRH